MNIAGREIGSGHPVFIVCEISCAHGGDFERAEKLIYEAKRAGADAVKFQCFTADEMTLDRKDWRAPPPWDSLSLYELYEKAATPRAWFPYLFAYAKEQGLIAFSTVASPDGVAFLESLDCPAYKIASAELPYDELWLAIWDTGKPIIASTGMMRGRQINDEIPDFVSLHGEDAYNLALLHCVSAYPSSIADAKLSGMLALSGAVLITGDEIFGISDHSPGWQIPVMAVALGAQIIEKHMQLDATDGNLDHMFALHPYEFREMVKAVRMAEAAMQEPVGDPEKAARQFRRRLIDGRWIRCGPEAKG